MPEQWNRGFATEMGRASLEIGFERLGFPEVASWACRTIWLPGG